MGIQQTPAPLLKGSPGKGDTRRLAESRSLSCDDRLRGCDGQLQLIIVVSDLHTSASI